MSLQWIIENELGLYRGPASVGLIKGETGWILVDSGVEADVPKKIVKALSQHFEGETVRISAVINTHAHADHCGGNQWLKEKHQAKIYASRGEQPYIENPFLEPHYLFSAEAPKALKNKFFQAPASQVDQAIDFNGAAAGTGTVGQTARLAVDGTELDMICIPGHSKEMIGVRTASNHFFCGDLLFTKVILDKHPMLFLHDCAAYEQSLKWALSQAFSGVILTHGGYFEDHLPLAEATLDRLQQNRAVIVGAIDRPINEWEIHQRVSTAFELEENLGGWHLNHGVVRSYLAEGLGNNCIKWENGFYAPAGATE